MSAIESLLRAHIAGCREAVAAAVERIDALEALTARLSTEAPPQPTVRPHEDGWSREEDAVLIEHYRALGAKGCQNILPHRSLAAIRARACRKLKLSTPKFCDRGKR